MPWTLLATMSTCLLYEGMISPPWSKSMSSISWQISARAAASSVAFACWYSDT
jgi:hypothetical protein